jgi:peptidoglycan hydrolase-like protein with peptidoglycan-binding domain
MNDSVDVFISYAREDRPDAQLLAGALSREGWTVWWDREIRVGQSFDREIEAALAGARAVIVLWSRAATTSTWVRAEAGDAADRGVLVPARLDDTEVPLRFRSLQTADLRGWRRDAAGAGVDDLLQAVRALVATVPALDDVPAPVRSAAAPTGPPAAGPESTLVVGTTVTPAGAPDALAGGTSTTPVAHDGPVSLPRTGVDGSPKRRGPAWLVPLVMLLLGGAGIGAWAVASRGGDDGESSAVPTTATPTTPAGTTPAPTTPAPATPASGTPAPTPASDCPIDLVVACRGAQVEELQRLLLAAGLDPGGVDGDFGPRTDAALRAFEAACDVCVADGRITVGSDEWAALMAAASPVPDIAGEYFLDPDNARIILITGTGDRTYRIEEQFPANWPFTGTISWTDDGRFEGDATFAAGGTMHVTVVHQSDHSLETTFEFMTENGQPSDRIDRHVLVPVG